MHPTDPGSFARLQRQRSNERLAFLSVIGVLFLFLVVQSRKPKPCVLTAGATKVYVPSPRHAKRVTEELTKRLRSRFGPEVRFDEEVLWYPQEVPAGREVVSVDQAVKVLERAVQPIVKATAITIDGEPVLMVRSKSMAQDVMREFMAQYVDPKAVGGDPPKTREKVTFVDRDDIPASTVLSDVSQAVAKLKEGGTTEKYYLVQSGDTGYGIAKKHGLSLEELERMNPSVDWTRLSIDQRLCVQQARSPLTVVTHYETTLKEPIPFPTKTVKSKDLPRGTSKVERQGKDGLREVTYRVECENGVPLGKTRVGEARLVTHPEPKLVIVGDG